ncbi:ABC transporter permease subunit [Candidatus Roizmanbacteria bacterium]|nr:ABC transporter permease subunit [Candidatus Roizmanbacteria bacterium]
MQALFKKEIRYYLNNPIGYIILVLFAVFANFLFLKDIFLVGSASLRTFFNFLPWLWLVFIPAITMRSLAEEKRINTLETLLSLPVSETQIVLAKFTALSFLIFIGLGLTIVLPVSLFFLARLYLPEVLIAYVGVALMGMGFVAISLYSSTKTKNQVVAFLVSALVLFLLLVLASDFLSSVLPLRVQEIISYFSPVYQLQPFIKGVVDLRSVVYFISLICLFLFFTIIDLEQRA